jgi:hypothetical protein
MSKKLSPELNFAAKFFNWGEISRRFSGTRSVIRKDSIPDIHEPIITEIVQAADAVLKKHNITQ